ncbi:hypothetical protein [Gymnodinialimonas hymeniacidonis]|uniref:hypothetical protein n=1 Tax=Gymnodinialimonas hymeniacidonis TaxID=3126508 RepID=UPI0034C6B97A
MVDRIRAQSTALVADLPTAPLGTIYLACNCDNCINADALQQLRRVSPPNLTERVISQYFGGVGAVLVEANDETRNEARVILTHVIALFGKTVARPSDDPNNARRSMSYFDADYLLPDLLATNVLSHLPQEQRAQIDDYLLDVAHYAVASGSRFVDTALTYLTIFTDRFPGFLESYQSGPQRKHLRLWTALARGFATKEANTMHRGKDIHLFYRGMPRSDRDLLLATLESKTVGDLLERYAVHAKDEEWLQYLSNLMEWREATILSTRYSSYKDGKF